jgi:YcxB-like protein
MELTFQLTKEDLVAFHDDMHRRSHALRGMNRRALIWIGVVYLLLAGVVWAIYGDPIVPGVVLFIGMIVIFIIPRRSRKQRGGLVRKIYGGPENEALFAPQTLRIEPDQLVHETAAGSSTIKWPYLEAIDTTPLRTFIYIGALRAYIIPRRQILAGNYESFVQDAQQCYQTALEEKRRWPDEPNEAESRNSLSRGEIINPRKELVYQLSAQDLLANSDRNATRLGPLRKLYWRAAFAMFLVFLVTSVMVLLIWQNVVVAGATLAIGVVFVPLMPLMLKRTRRRLVTKVYDEQANRDLLKPRRLRIESEFLCDENVFSTGRVRWHCIKKIETTDGHAFVYVDGVNAIVIPKDGVLRGEYEMFLTEMLRHWRGATASRV